MDDVKYYPNSDYANLTVKEMVFKIIEEFFEFPEGKEPSKQEEIVNRLSEIKKHLADSDKFKYENKILQPQVSRALKQLIAEKKIVKNDISAYIPFDIKFKRKPLAEKIKKEVIFTNPNIFKISSYAILVPVDSKSLYNAKFLFKEYLEEDCTDILELDGYMLILLPQKYSDDMEVDDQDIVAFKTAMDTERSKNREIRKTIRKLVEDCYNEQQRKPLAKIKITKSKAQN